MSAAPKRMIVRDLTVNEVSSVDIPAVKGATAVLLKSGSVAIRKNAAEIAAGEAAPLYKAAEYGDAMIVRAGEIAATCGCSPQQAFLDHSGTDPVLIELAHAERAAEVAVMKARSDRHFATGNVAKLPPVRPEQRTCMLCTKAFESKEPRATHQMCDECVGG